MLVNKLVETWRVVCKRTASELIGLLKERQVGNKILQSMFYNAILAEYNLSEDFVDKLLSFIYEHDFGENVNASPTLVAGKLYVLSLDGTMFIGTPGEKEFTLETSNALGEECFASPAFMPGRIYIRGEEHLYCIGNEKP